MFVAIYARHSTDKQSKSTKDQVARLQKYCDRAGYTVTDVFIDEAKSGSHVQNRRGIRRLLTQAVEDCFERIVTEDLSRISRDQGDVANFYKKVSYLDISIETLSEGVINELHIGLKGTMNALYLKDLADKTHRGMIASVLKGAIPGGQTYGYDIVRQLDERGEPIRGLRKINDYEASVIRQIFADYAAGKTLRAICADLNVQAIEAPKGGLWVATTLVGTASRKTGLLRQTLYAGVVTFNRMAYRKHPDTGKRLSVLRSEDEWINVPVPELAIVDEETFEAVQAMLEGRSSMRAQRILTNKVSTPKEKAARAAENQRTWRAKQLSPKKALHTIISGKLYCARHGEKIMAFYKGPSGTVYGCPKKGCPNRNIKLTDLLPLAVEAAASIDTKAVRAYFDSAEVAAERIQHQAAIADLTPQIDAMRAEVHNVIINLGRQTRTAEIRNYFDDRARQIKRLKLDIEAHERQLAQLTPPARTQDVLTGYRYWVKRLQESPADREATLIMRPVITRVTLEAAWDDQEETWRRHCRIDLDYKKLLKLQQR